MIIVFGSLNVDLVLGAPEHPRPGETVICTSSKLGPGGKGTNQAVGAARACGEVVLIGRRSGSRNAGGHPRVLRIT